MSGERRGDRRLVRVQIDGVRKRVGSVASDEEAADLRAAIYARAGDVVGPTLETWGTTWLDERESVHKVRGIRTERGRWKAHIATAPFYRKPLATLSAGDVDAWLVELARKKSATPRRTPAPLAMGTIRATVSLLRQCLSDAVPKHLGSSPAEGVKARLKKLAKARQGDDVDDEPWTYLEPDEQRALTTSESIPEAHRLMIAFAIYTGLRQGEQYNLELRDLHVDGRDAAAPWLTVRYGSKGKLPKSGKIRRVPLNGPAAAACRRWLEILSSYAPKNPIGLVFPGPSGARMAVGKTPLVKSVKGSVTGKVEKVDLFKRYLTSVGITRDVRWHDLRHTCASSLVAGWWGRPWTLEETREALGHRSSVTTQRYAHLGESAMRAAARSTAGWAVPVPTPASTSLEELAVSAQNHLVGRQGLEPWTYGLKVPPEGEELRELSLSSGHAGGQALATLGDRAVAALSAVAARDPLGGDLLVRVAADVAELAHQMTTRRHAAGEVG